MRMSTSWIVDTCTLSPKRSSSCGRSSPSCRSVLQIARKRCTAAVNKTQAQTCALPEPIMMNLAGWLMLMPSRSTALRPDAALSRTTSTKASSSRLTSSMYRMPLFARACAQAGLSRKLVSLTDAQQAPTAHQQAWVEGFGSLLQRLLDVDGPADAVLCGP